MKALCILMSLVLSLSSMASQEKAKAEVGLKELLAKASALELKKTNSNGVVGEKKEELDLSSASHSLINVNDSARELTSVK